MKPVTESVAIAEGAKYRNTATVLPTTNTLGFDKNKYISRSTQNILSCLQQILSDLKKYMSQYKLNISYCCTNMFNRNKLASLGATLVRNYDPLTD